MAEEKVRINVRVSQRAYNTLMYLTNDNPYGIGKCIDRLLMLHQGRPDVETPFDPDAYLDKFRVYMVLLPLQVLRV